MKKSGFTLIELIISIIILSLVMSFFIFFIADTKTKISYQDNLKITSRQKVKTQTILYDDFSRASDVLVGGGRNYSVVTLRSNNSLYGIQKPYVAWLVLPDNNKLVRYESAYKFSIPITNENRNTIFAETIADMCEYFYVSKSLDLNTTLIYFKRIGDTKPTVVGTVNLTK